MYKTGDRLTENQSYFIISNLNVSKEIENVKGNDNYKAGSTSINSALRGASLSDNTAKVINHLHKVAEKVQDKRNGIG
tara:strand:+ start:740 stop:973 length:234 start_codon:yes stop_codon:yes gene_type:complete